MKLTTAGIKSDSTWSLKESMKLPGNRANLIEIRTQLTMNKIKLNKKNDKPR